MKNLVRWEVIGVEKDNYLVHVMDRLSNRSNFYQVPFLISAIINEHLLDVETSNGRVMRINLHDGSRQLIV